MLQASAPFVFCVVVNPSTAQFDLVYAKRFLRLLPVDRTACYIRSGAKDYGKIDATLAIDPPTRRRAIKTVPQNIVPNSEYSNA